jgi:hypothetical protein
VPGNGERAARESVEEVFRRHKVKKYCLNLLGIGLKSPFAMSVHTGQEFVRLADEMEAH